MFMLLMKGKYNYEKNSFYVYQPVPVRGNDGFAERVCRKNQGTGAFTRDSGKLQPGRREKDGCVVHENGDISSGEKAWDSFVEQSSDGKPSSVRIGYYYTLDDSAKYTAEDYEQLKKEYPVLFLKDLEFDGEQYTLLSYEDGSEQKREYSYLKKFEGDAGADAVYDSYIQYVLTDEKDATWEQLMKSLYSSQTSDFIDFQIVYTDYIYE